MKKTIRRDLLERRNSLYREERLAASRIITDRLTDLPDYRTARTIMLYVSFGSEVSTERLIGKALNNKYRVAVPLVRPESGEMKAILIRDPVRDLSPGFKGIREPELDPDRELSVDRLDLVIVPGVAFDSAGNRVGMGKGYYDRFLRNLLPDTHKVALAFERQIVAAIPGDENDVKMDVIVTEERVICCRGTADGRQKTEDGRLMTEDRGRKTEDGRRRTEDRGRKTEDGRQRTEDRGRKTEDRKGAGNQAKATTLGT